jgi:hypothetical protein
MTRVTLEDNDYLNVEVIGSLDLPKIIFSNSLGSDLKCELPLEHIHIYCLE